MIDIKFYKSVGGGTHTKIKFYISFIFFLFLTWILKILNMGRAGGLARGGKGELSVQKNEKITRTAPILKSNST